MSCGIFESVIYHQIDRFRQTVFFSAKVAIVKETFRFLDENENEDEISLKKFFAYSQTINTPKSFMALLFHLKISTVIFTEEAEGISRPQNDKTSN